MKNGAAIIFGVIFLLVSRNNLPQVIKYYQECNRTSQVSFS